MDNRSLIERVFEFEVAVRKKNQYLAANIPHAIMSLLQYDKPLEEASREQLLDLPSITERNVDYFVRIFKGEPVDAIAKEIPERHCIGTRRGEPTPYERGNWNGSWDNAVKIYEGE